MHKFRVSTRRREELQDITSEVARVIGASGLKSGLCVVYCPHTTAALTVNEGADPDVAEDIISGLGHLVPSSLRFKHAEGNSDAHIKASLFGPSLTLIVEEGRPVLGTWQRIFFCEFDGPRERSVFVRTVAGGAGKE
ncbi:MAG: YjbQ family protein [bacterium]|nr:MAG: YjbQ family protein [bacterium]